MGLAMLDAARTHAEELGASAMRLQMDLHRVECLLIAGDVANAGDEARALHRELTSEHEGDPQFVGELLPLMAIAALRAGDEEAAETAAVEALELARAASNHYATALALLVRAALGERHGVDATSLLEEVAALFDRLGVRQAPPAAIRSSRSAADRSIWLLSSAEARATSRAAQAARISR
jgi:hypothetical protein